MSGSQIGGGIGYIVGSFFGAPQLGFFLGSALGGYIDPVKIRGPRLTDAQQQTSQEGIPIPFGFGSFPCSGNVIWASVLTEHEKKEGGKGGPQTITYTYTRSYAIGVCEGEAFIQQIKRNGKLVYDISPTSTITGKSAKFLKRCTIYTGDETQTVDPTIEADVGVGNSGPMRGLCYIVMEDDDVTDFQGAIPQYEFVVQKCGEISYPADSRGYFVAGLESIDSVATASRDGVWTAYPSAIPADKQLRFVAASHNHCVAFDAETNENFYFSTDRGETWALATNQPPANRQWRYMAPAPGMAVSRFMAIAAGTGPDVGKSYIGLTSDGGDHWSFSELAGIVEASAVKYGGGVYVLLTTSTGSGIYKTTSFGGAWTRVSTETNLDDLAYNGFAWVAVGGNAKTCSAPGDATTWTNHGSPGTGSYSFTCVTNTDDGSFIAGATDHYGIWRTSNLGGTWTQVFSGGTDQASAALGMGTVVVAAADTVRFSDDNGTTWTSHDTPTPGGGANWVAYMGPGLNWYQLSDGDGLYADETGDLITDYTDTPQVSSCRVQVAEIVAALCERASIDASEYDVSELTDYLDGYKCATEASAEAFIAPLMQGFFFDRAEWDKKLRFPKRGRSSVAALDLDDLVADETAVIKWERTQEVELLRKVNLMTINPASGYVMGKQSAERRIATIQARAEASIEIPIVCDADTSAGIADKTIKVAWAETAKAGFKLPQEFSYLTPTDVVTLTDRALTAHRIRLESIAEEGGVWTVGKAPKDRASTYSSVATGVENPNDPGDPDTVTGPTLFVPMNLPQLRTQDNSPGVYVAARGILDGWNGCVVLLSLDGGVSYTTALTIENGTTMGNLTAAMGASDSPDVASVHVFGALESKTAAQVNAGGNWSAIIPNTAPTYVATSTDNEILAYEDATETAPAFYTLSTLSRGLLDTTADAHSEGDHFVDLSGVYFIPVSADFAGQTLYFKAVSFGLSADSVNPVTLLFEATEYVLDGGGA